MAEYQVRLFDEKINETEHRRRQAIRLIVYRVLIRAVHNNYVFKGVISGPLIDSPRLTHPASRTVH